MPGAKGNKPDKKSATKPEGVLRRKDKNKQQQSNKDQTKKSDQKGDDNKKQGGQPKGEKQ